MALDLALHPAWLMASARAGMPRFETLEKYGPPGAGAPSLAAYVASYITDELGPDLLRRIRDAWTGKLVIKGIMSVDSAEEAVEIGADGIVVSNHGGRQFDGAPAAIEVLPKIAAAVGGRLSILMDSGVRSGKDVLRAVSLGAEFVFSGCSFVYGAAAAGPAGAAHTFQIFKDDIFRSMAQLGVTDLVQMRPTSTTDAATCTPEKRRLQAFSWRNVTQRPSY